MLDYFNDVVFVSSIFNYKDYNKFLNFHKKINKEINIILFGPLPSVNKIDPLKCLIRSVDCYIDIKKDLSSRKIKQLTEDLENYKKKTSNIKIFYPYFELCSNQKNNKCLIYDSKIDLLTHRDGQHLTVEGSISLLKSFNKFLSDEY